MTLTLETGLSSSLKIQFIDEIVQLHGFSKITTSAVVQPDVVNIECSNNETLELILSKINSNGLSIVRVDKGDTVIMVS